MRKPPQDPQKAIDGKGFTEYKHSADLPDPPLGVCYSLGKSIDELVELLKPDPWRMANPFSTEVETSHELLFDPAVSRAEKAHALNLWLRSFQPCIFGRIAANKNLLAFCILTDNDVAKGDDHLRELIQNSRRAWKEQALTGSKHGFLILLISKIIAYAEPGDALREVALRLCELYLSRATVDEILLDDVILSIDSEDPSTSEHRSWKVGVNWFGAQADGRWWQDHRIPGGVGFSMNSVGHMARKLVEEAIRKDARLAQRIATLPREQLVTWALPVAMRTIYTASKGPVPGTRLKDREDTALPDGVSEAQRTEILRGTLCPFSEDEYYGWYNTDTSIPSEYFDPNPVRTPDEEMRLPFTYLHRRSDDAYLSMGLGEPVEEALGLTGFEDADPLE